MDPYLQDFIDGTLKSALKVSRLITKGKPVDDDQIIEMAACVISLDEWLAGDGPFPKRWSMPHSKRTAGSSRKINANLKKQVRIANLITGEKPVSDDEIYDLAELLFEMDDWIATGGVLPSRWDRMARYKKTR
jgi:hypothetical protein